MIRYEGERETMVVGSSYLEVVVPDVNHHRMSHEERAEVRECIDMVEERTRRDGPSKPQPCGGRWRCMGPAAPRDSCTLDHKNEGVQ